MPSVSAVVTVGLGSLLLLTLALGVVVLVVINGQRQQQAQRAMAELRARHERQLLASRVEIEERERQRIARSVHDNLGPLLSLIKFELHRLQRNHPRVDDLLDLTTREVRQISHELYPILLQRLGLPALLRELADTYATEHLSIDLRQEEAVGQQLNQAQQIALYRITSELLVNVRRHGRARQVQLTLRRDGPDLTYHYRDDGVGFDLSTYRPGLGLDSVHVRVEQLGGQLLLDTAPGQGLTLSFAFRV